MTKSKFREIPIDSTFANLHDYIMPPAPGRVPPPRQHTNCGLRVTDDWPDTVPITEQELRVIEGHFADGPGCAQEAS